MNCDPIARWYRWMEYLSFGRELERRRVAWFASIADARRVLALGEGDGRALAALLATAPHAQVDYVDLSERMLALAQARNGNGRVAYYRGDALTMPLPPGSATRYDLIVSHFFLDCFDKAQMNLLIERIVCTTAPQARWIVSEFRKPGLVVWILYRFFRIATGLRTQKLVDHHPLLHAHGFRLAREESAWRGLLASELWQRGG